VQTLPQLLPPAEIGTAQQEIPVELFAIESCCPDDHGFTLYGKKLYPTRRSAEVALAMLRAKAIINEQEDWETDPCECGNRNCDYRSRLFPEFSIIVLQLADS
jgi:hypothetical protein